MLTISMFQKGNKKRLQNRKGFVSLIVVAILAVVLGLVAVGFSALMNHEARRALDNELSAQAYYSAIAGLNDSRAYLAACIPNGGNCDLTGCSDWQNLPANYKQYFAPNLDNSGAAKYSCLSISTTTGELIYGPIQPDQSVTFNLDGKNLSKMFFGWQNYNQTAGSFTPLGSSLGSLPQNTTVPSGATGMLEVNMYPNPSGWTGDTFPTGWPANQANTNAVLEAYSRTYNMYPNSDTTGNGTPGEKSYANDNGSFVPGNCRANNKNPVTKSTTDFTMCNADISDLNSGFTYLVRLTARYEPLYVTVQAEDSGGNPVQMGGAQAEVDVTGQGTDVLQRVRARIDLSKSQLTPTYGVQSMVGICKGFEVEMQSQGNYGDANNYFAGSDPDNACAYPANTNNSGVVGPSTDSPPHNGLPQPQNPAVVTASLSSNSGYNLTAGQSATLSWSSTGAYKCDGGSSGGPAFNTGGAPNGSTNPPIGPLSAGTYTYTLTCTGFGGQATSQVKITVAQPPPPAPIMNPPSPGTVWNGQSSTLSWTSTNATSCAGNGFSTGGATSGSASTGSLSPGTHAFYITCTGPGGTINSNVVYVTSNLQTCSATASPGSKTSAASASGSCNPASYQAPQWTYSYTANTPCGVDTGSGSGNSVGWIGEVGTFTVTFTIHGFYGGIKSATVGPWTQTLPGFC